MNIGRNEICPCGSGKKYKKCCMNKERKEDFNKVKNEKLKICDEEIDEEMIYNFEKNFQKLILKNKLYIKEYNKARKIHGEVLDSMMKYYDSGKFEKVITSEQPLEEIKSSKDLEFIDSNFDTATQLGEQAWINVLVYKNSVNMNCITEEFLNKNRFKRPEKVEMLNSMLHSQQGLFEIISTDMMSGQVILRNVLTNKEILVTDIGLSSNYSNEFFYMYTRIISYNNINFGTGLSIIFNKEDEFICNWIKKYKKEYIENQELKRFMELYNKYERDNNKIKVKINDL